MLALRVTPCNRKHQSGEEEKTKNAKQVRKRDKKTNKQKKTSMSLDVKGSEKLRKVKVD